MVLTGDNDLLFFFTRYVFPQNGLSSTLVVHSFQCFFSTHVSHKKNAISSGISSVAEK